MGSRKNVVASVFDIRHVLINLLQRISTQAYLKPNIGHIRWFTVQGIQNESVIDGKANRTIRLQAEHRTPERIRVKNRKRGCPSSKEQRRE
jgi:hypothetical protein